MRKHVLVFPLLLFFIAVSILLFTPTCYSENESPQLNLTMYVHISDINFENHTVLAGVILEIEGFPENAGAVYVKFDNIELYEVNCSRFGGLVNGTYNFKGEANGKYWYLVSYGEVYPFDYCYMNLNLYPNSLEYDIDGARYGLTYPFSFNVVEEQVTFVGLHKVDLENKWAKSPVMDGERLLVYFFRNELSPQLLIIVPLFWFLSLVAAAPSLSSNKNIKARLYSSILVFSPMFIFAIQDFIPPRNSLSIPEFLGLTLMFLAVTMFVFLLPKFKTEKSRFYAEISGLIASWGFSYVLGFLLFQRFLILLPVLIIMFLLIALFALTVILRYLRYNRHEKEQRHSKTEKVPYSV